MKIIHRRARFQIERTQNRRGGLLVLALFCFIGCLAFVSLSVDMGYLTVQKTRMQNAVDAAALAAAQEISHAVQTAPEGTEDVTAYALNSARNVAANVASLNGVYVNPQTDVIFGTRTFNAGTQTYGINWGSTPANVVKVVARRDGDDPSQQDGKLRLFFAKASGGDSYATVKAQAVAYIEARDLVVVHDFSLSMSYDSSFNSYSTSHLTDEQITASLQLAWDDLTQLCSFGSLTFTPQYLAMSQTSTDGNGVTQSVTFKYNSADVSVNKGVLKSLKINSKTNVTVNGSPTSYTYTGGSSTDITSVEVTSELDAPSTEESFSSSGYDITFSADRKSVTISSSTKLRNLEATFTNGSSDTKSWTKSSGPTSYTYSSSKAIDSIRLKRTSGSGTTSWSTFDASPAEQTKTYTFTFEDTNTNVKKAFGLDNLSYPANSGNWDGFINHSRNDSYLRGRGYREMYGGLSLVNYILQNEYGNSRWPQLGQVRHYPFHSIKEGHQLLCEFLEDLGFDDHIGMVSYDLNHRVEKVLDETGLPYVNITNKPITNDYASVNNLMKYKQAAHYGDIYTNTGGGLGRAIELLDGNKRAGARPTILLMTDGNANRKDSGDSSTLPSGWNWNTMFDYDGDGSSDYSTNDDYKKVVLKKAYEAVNKGYTVHTMSVGADADTALMEAVAHIGQGVHISVPGGMSVADMEDDVRAAFHKIASFVPPAKLLNNP